VAPSSDTRVRVPDDVVFRALDGEAVVLNLESGIYFGLDAIGTRMWQLVTELESIGSARDQLLAEFDAPAAQLESDLLTFVGELHAKKLVTFE
jgi:hypothetical protein